MKVLTHIFTPTGALRWPAAFLVTILGFGLALGLTIGYVAKTRTQDDRRWCDLLGTLVQPQPSSPPQTPQEVRGRRVTEQIRRLHDEFGCGR